MKRISLLAALLLAVSACSTTPAPSNSNTAPGNTNANTSTTGGMVKDADIIAKEKEIYDALKAGNSEAFGSLLAEDFVYIAGDGVHDKTGTINGVKEFKPTELNFSDWKVIIIDKDAAIVTYKLAAKGTSGGQPIPETPIYGASAWVKRGDKWLGLFHQETEVKPMAPEESASKEPAKPAAAGTETKPAAPVVPDANHEAREKQVWDALKKKDYETFAKFLAEDQIEIWESGVNDKKGSIEGVKHVDFSGATLSDFKTVKLDDDAVLVTYVAKGPTPPFGKNGDRQTSIWASRGGTWLAVFHQGTSITPPQVMPSKK